MNQHDPDHIPTNLKELYVDVGVLKSQVARIERFQWWILGILLTGLILPLLVGLVILTVRGA